MPLVPDVISRLCSSVPTEMRHSRDIVQACPGGGPVIPNQSLAVQCLERKIRTQEFRFVSFFFQWMLNSKLFFSLYSFCLPQLSFYSSLPSYYIDHFWLVCHVSWRLYSLLCHHNIFWVRYSWQTPAHVPVKYRSLSTLSPAFLQDETYYN